MKEDGGPSLYAFTGNDMLGFIDPLGLKKCEIAIFEGHNYDVFPEIDKFADASQNCYAVGALSCKSSTQFPALDEKRRKVGKPILLTLPESTRTKYNVTGKDGELPEGDRSYGQMKQQLEQAALYRAEQLCAAGGGACGCAAIKIKWILLRDDNPAKHYSGYTYVEKWEKSFDCKTKKLSTL